LADSRFNGLNPLKKIIQKMSSSTPTLLFAVALAIWELVVVKSHNLAKSSRKQAKHIVSII
jgi:hypothetical protein